jgi:DNA-binding NtrC family response regulator
LAVILEEKYLMTHHRILLIDPSKNLLNAYRMVLEEEKYSVETALNLKDAYQLFILNLLAQFLCQMGNFNVNINFS